MGHRALVDRWMRKLLVLIMVDFIFFSSSGGVWQLNVVDGRMQYLFDENGRRYLDAFGGIATVGCGHCHPDVVNAIVNQTKRLQHSTILYLNSAIADFAEALASKLPGNLKVCEYSYYFPNLGWWTSKREKDSHVPISFFRLTSNISLELLGKNCFLVFLIGGFFYEFWDWSKRVGYDDSEVVYWVQWYYIVEKRLPWKRSWDYGGHSTVQLEIQYHTGNFPHLLSCKIIHKTACVTLIIDHSLFAS